MKTKVLFVAIIVSLNIQTSRAAGECEGKQLTGTVKSGEKYSSCGCGVIGSGDPTHRTLHPTDYDACDKVIEVGGAPSEDPCADTSCKGSATAFTLTQLLETGNVCPPGCENKGVQQCAGHPKIEDEGKKCTDCWKVVCKKIPVSVTVAPTPKPSSTPSPYASPTPSTRPKPL